MGKRGNKREWKRAGGADGRRYVCLQCVRLEEGGEGVWLEEEDEEDGVT
jgi:hypothetical protein